MIRQNQRIFATTSIVAKISFRSAAWATGGPDNQANFALVESTDRWRLKRKLRMSRFLNDWAQP